MFADPLIECAHIQLNNGLVWNDVLFCACLQDTNRYHGSIGRSDFSRDDGLQPHDGRGSHDDGINAGLGHRAMGTTPEHSNL